MKTQNTLENKAQFLGHHIGCEVEFFNKSKGGWRGDKLTYHNFSFYAVQNCRVLLTPLSLISDEDAIECAKLFKWLQVTDTPQLWNHPTTKEKVVKMNDNYKYGICILSNENLNQQQIDFLRSKSYAIPFRDLSVEEYVNYGWGNLKSE